jgi:hypothetical protein
MNWNSGSEAELKPDLFQAPRFTCYMGNKKAQKASLLYSHELSNFTET